MTATWSEHDQHDDQIMHAAHEALRPMTATRFRPVPGMTPAEGAPPKVMISSEGTGMHADSATMSRNATAYPQMAMRCCTELLSCSRGPGMLSASPDEAEVGDAGQPCDEAVDTEQSESPGAQVAEQEPDRQIGAHAGQRAADHDLAADPAAERAEQVRDLQCPAPQDDGGCEKECEPPSSGIFSAPAARTTGVARRNANRAASSRDSPLIMPATMVTPSRLIPASSARICADRSEEHT